MITTMRDFQYMLVSLLALMVCGAACSDASSSNEQAGPAATAGAPFDEVVATPRALDVSSKTLAVSGEFRSLAIDRVERLALANGTLQAHGAAASVAIDVPPGADLSRPSGRWTLVTDANLDAGKLLVFTHEESLDEVEVTLPPTDAPIRFGVFQGRGGEEVLVLAWGESSRSYCGWVQITKRGA
jgi:hypothetical protein